MRDVGEPCSGHVDGGGCVDSFQTAASGPETPKFGRFSGYTPDLGVNQPVLATGG